MIWKDGTTYIQQHYNQFECCTRTNDKQLSTTNNNAQYIIATMNSVAGTQHEDNDNDNDIDDYDFEYGNDNDDVPLVQCDEEAVNNQPDVGLPNNQYECDDNDYDAEEDCNDDDDDDFNGSDEEDGDDETLHGEDEVIIYNDTPSDALIFRSFGCA
jgi:hypothetical protein